MTVVRRATDPSGLLDEAHLVLQVCDEFYVGVTGPPPTHEMVIETAFDEPVDKGGDGTTDVLQVPVWCE